MTDEDVFQRIATATLNAAGERSVDLSANPVEDAAIIQAVKRAASFGHCAHIRSFDLRWTKVTDAGFTAVAENCPSLTSLDISKTLVTDAGLRAIAESCSNLTSLNISETQVTDAGLRVVAEACPKIQYLDLQKTGVTDAGVRRIAESCPELEYLNLWDVTATDAGVRAVAEHCPQLKYLNLWNAKVTDAGMRSLGKGCPELHFLDISWTDVTGVGVQAVASQCPKLQSLHLFAIQVTDAVMTIVAQKCPDIKSLRIWNAKFTDRGLRAIAEHCPHLQFLELGHTEVTDDGMEAVAEHCSHLRSLDLQYENITDVGVRAVAERCQRLDSLELDEVQVTDAGIIAVAEHCPRLEKLHIPNTKVTDAGMRSVAKQCTQLNSLDVTCTDVSGAGVQAVVESCLRLRSLCLAGTQVNDTVVRAVTERCPELSSLEFTGIEVTDGIVRSVAENCSQLRYLDLTETQVTDAGIRAVVENLRHLRLLYLRRNVELRLPREFTDRPGNVALLRAFYARSEVEGRRQLNEAKVIVVGNEAVGKSALVEYLVNKTPCRDSTKTIGVQILDRINVATWDAASAATYCDPLRLNVWDFGGQDVLYETHKLFLTARSLYLVVLEARRENTTDADNVLHDWMRAVGHRGGEDVPVVVVINKAESPHDLRLDEVRLSKDYPAIRAFIRTSCKNPADHIEGGKGITELRQLIINVVRKDIAHVRDWFPTSYFNVKEELAQIAGKEFFLSTARYASLCCKYGITDEKEQDDLLTLLDRIGVVVRHRDNTLLDPNWLTTAIYRILTHSDVVKAHGEFSKDDLGTLLRDIEDAANKYPKDRWPYIVDQTVACGLSFELPNQPGRYLMPEQLPPNEPDLNWHKGGTLRFRYDYTNLPRGLLPRFIVEMHRNLTPNRTAWASGVMLAVGECKVLVRANRRDRKVLIFVDGPHAERREALALIREGFGRVHALLEDLKPNPMVPVDVPGDPDAAFDYNQLIEFERQGLIHTTLKGAKKPFKVTDLLGGVGLEPRDRPSRNPRKPIGKKDGMLEWGHLVRFTSEGPVNLNIGSPVNVAVTSSQRTVLTEALQLSEGSAKPKSWQYEFIGPAIAAFVAAGLAGMYLCNANPELTAVLTIAAVVFAVVYVLKARLLARSVHWPKPLMYACVSAAAMSAALPGVNVVVDGKSLGQIGLWLDSGPWLTPAFLVAAIVFGVLQVVRERGGHHKE